MDPIWKIRKAIAVAGAVCVLFATVFAQEDPRLVLARKKMEDGQWNAAATEYKKYLGQHPKDWNARMELASLRMGQKNFKLAIVNYNYALESKPGNMGAMQGLAAAYQNSGQIEKAVRQWRTIATLSEEDEVKKKAEAQIKNLLEKGSRAAAEGAKSKEKKKVSKKTPVKLKNQEMMYKDLHYLKAHQLYRAKDYDKALVEIRKALAAYPSHPGAYYLAGVIRYNREEYDKALYNFSKGFKDPESGYNGHFYRGRIFQKQNNSRRAIEEFKEYVALTESQSGRAEAEKYIAELSSSGQAEPVIQPAVKPSSSQVILLKTKDGEQFYAPGSPKSHVTRFKKAAALYAGLRVEKAVEELKQIQLEYGGSLSAELASINLSLVYLNLGLYEKSKSAAAHFLKDAQVPLLHDMARYIVASDLRAMKMYEVALESVSEIRPNAQYGPGKLDLARLKSGLLMEAGRTEEAIVELKAVLEAQPDPRDLQTLGDLYAAQPNFDNAVLYYKKSLEKCGTVPACGGAHMRLADLFYKKKEYPEALKWYDSFKDKYGDHPDVSWGLYQIGNVYNRMGKDLEAISRFEELMGLFPDSYWAAQAKWKHEDILWNKEHGNIIN